MVDPQEEQACPHINTQSFGGWWRWCRDCGSMSDEQWKSEGWYAPKRVNVLEAQVKELTLEVGQWHERWLTETQKLTRERDRQRIWAQAGLHGEADEENGNKLAAINVMVGELEQRAEKAEAEVAALRYTADIALRALEQIEGATSGLKGQA